jgi:hypothetical protein
MTNDKFAQRVEGEEGRDAVDVREELLEFFRNVAAILVLGLVPTVLLAMVIVAIFRLVR